MKISKIEAGYFYIDGGAAFGVVPKIVWNKRYPANADNYCRVATRCLLVDTGEHKVLFDTGAGDKQPDYLKLYRFETMPNLKSAINQAGYDCAEITDVVFTHLHFDHAGGATVYNSDKSKVELLFPNATHWVGKAQWENFLAPNVREGDSYFAENVQPIMDAGKLNLVSENLFIAPEIELRLYHGHTVGQLAGYIHSGDKTLLLAGDVIPLAGNVPLAWLSSFDIQPIIAMEEKKILLDEVADGNYYLVFVHDSYNECATVVHNYYKHKVDKTFKLSEIV